MNIDKQKYPDAAAFVEELERRKDRFIVPYLEKLYDQYGEEHLAFLSKMSGLSRSVGGKPVDAVLKLWMKLARGVIEFQKTGKYSHDAESFDDVFDEIYNNPAVMEGYYLDGIMVSRACWETQYLIHRFFREKFMPLCVNARRGVEIGFGHALYLYEILEYEKEQKGRNEMKAYGVDVSPYAVKYGTKLLSTAFAPEHFELIEGDIQKGLPFEDGSMEFGLLTDILEHIAKPAEALATMYRCMAAGAPLFIITPMNSNSVDHITNYESIGQIEEMIVSSGFGVIDRKPFAIKDYYPASHDDTVHYTGVFEKR